jgi:nucleotide-binding universal stress UspA family protein
MPLTERPEMNALPRLLVHFDASRSATARLALADALAQRHGSSITALFAATPSAMTTGAGALGDGLGAFSAGLEVDAELRARAKARFDAACPGPHARWEELAELGVTPAFLRVAWLHDLVIVGQHDRTDPDARHVPADFAEAVALGSGRPTLVVPTAGDFHDVGRRVLVGWKRAREAAVALTAALPLLGRAEQVHVLLPAGEQAALAAWLLRHEIDAVFHEDAPAAPDASAGERLLEHAAAVQADLLVMGCYGHARLRELVLGGASRTVLDRARLPVLMAH